ncbi:MAG TPA: TIGR00266 family protein [Aggregatilineaceae bacterium]|nr:TIGR00266 family protein [Aggregatilineaceae bacterium]
MKYEVKHNVMQSLEVQLNNGEELYTQAGGMAWMTDGIDMETTGKGGGVLGALGRLASGSSLLLTTYKCTAPSGMITFTTDNPGKILPMQLAPGQTLIAQRDTFLTAEPSVTFEATFTKKLSTGFFGGEGFILQKITGPGMFFAQIDGEVEEMTLQPGQIMRVHAGHIALFEPTVTYDIQMVKGLGNILFAGEGLFLATLRGPGQVWLQTMPISNLAAAIRQFIPTKSSN